MKLIPITMSHAVWDEQSSKSTVLSVLDPVDYLIKGMNSVKCHAYTQKKLNKMSRTSCISRLGTSVLREKFPHPIVILNITSDDVHKASTWSGN